MLEKKEYSKTGVKKVVENHALKFFVFYIDLFTDLDILRIFESEDI